MGREDKTDFIKTSFPAFVNQWPPKETILAFNLLKTSSRSEGGLAPKVKGRPKYLILTH